MRKNWILIGKLDYGTPREMLNLQSKGYHVVLLNLLYENSALCLKKLEKCGKCFGETFVINAESAG